MCCGTPLQESAPAQMMANGARSCSDSPPHFSTARAITRYRAGDDEEAPIPSMIRRHKYGLDQSLTHALAECLGDPLPLADSDYDVVVPVPLHRARLCWRGFNQAALLGIAVARRMRRPLEVDTLIRIRATSPQTAKDRRERYRNVRDAFAVKRPEKVANRRVLLIDDVMTTGATVDECARALLACGCSTSGRAALARVL